MKLFLSGATILPAAEYPSGRVEYSTEVDVISSGETLELKPLIGSLSRRALLRAAPACVTGCTLKKS
jgi:hypothetical protein